MVRSKIWVFACVLLFSNSHAASFQVDPTQSYVSIDIPTWERGEPWGFVAINTDGVEVTTVQGYDWNLVSRSKRFQLSGSVDVTELGPTYNGLTGLQLGTTDLASTAPSELGFGVPGFVSLNMENGSISWDNSCYGSSEFPTWCQVTTPQSATGNLLNGILALNGASSGLTFGLVSIINGGMGPPPDPEISLTNWPYEYHIVATVPEPSEALMIMVGLAMVLIVRSRIPAARGQLRH